jgi:hypothetical protein
MMRAVEQDVLAAVDRMGSSSPTRLTLYMRVGERLTKFVVICMTFALCVLCIGA